MGWFLIAIGGAAGAVSRYLVDTWVSERAASSFPVGHVHHQHAGSLALGLLFALVVERHLLPSEARAPLLIEFIGAYTTFSTRMLESWRLVEAGAVGQALANLIGSSLVGMVALIVGLTAGRALA